MVSRLQEEITIRYATKEEREQRDKLVTAYRDIFSEEIRANIEQRDKAASEAEQRQQLIDRTNTPAYKEWHEKLTRIAAELSALDEIIQGKYIDEIQNDIPLLLNDTAYVLELAFRDMYKAYLEDTIALYYEDTKERGRAFSYRRAARQFVLDWIEPQDKAFRKSSTKTEQDKAKYRQIIDIFVEATIKAITPEMKSRIEKSPTKRAKRDKAELLTPLKAVETFFTPNSYVNNNFMDILKYFYKENNGQMIFVPTEIEVDITGKSKGSLPIMLSINYEGDITKEGTKSIDYNKARIQGFDTAVLDAVCTILETEQHDIYISAIDALLNGRSNIQAVGKKREERILLALRKLRGTTVRLDITNEIQGKYAEAFKALDLKSGVLDAAMLEYTGLELANYAGQTTYVIHVDKMPAIYQYSKAKGEITSFPTALLNTPERAEERYTTLKVALLKRITLINKRIMNSNTILFESLYRVAGLEEKKEKGNRSKERDKLVDMLKYWKEQGYIKGYKQHYEGKAYTGFEIDPKYIIPNNKR